MDAVVEAGAIVIAIAAVAVAAAPVADREAGTVGTVVAEADAGEGRIVTSIQLSVD